MVLQSYNYICSILSQFFCIECVRKNEISRDPEKLFEYVRIVLFGLDQRASSLFFTKNDYNQPSSINHTRK